MKNLFDNIRYGSAIFMYITSSFFIINTILAKCTDIYSVLSFIISSVIISAILFCDKSHQSVGRLAAGGIAAAVSAGLVFELSEVLLVFSVSSDNADTKPGTYIFALIIAYTALFCAHFGADALIKLSNIVFVIPLISIIISSFGIFSVGAGVDILSIYSTDIKASLLSGIVCSLLVLSDVYIVIYMLKKEKCYNSQISIKVYIYTLCFILLISLVFRMTFGTEIGRKLYAPVISASGLIRGFDFEEIYLFSYSVCLLFRFACRIFVLSDMIKLIFIQNSPSKIFLNAFLIVISIVSAYIKNRSISGNSFEIIVSILYVPAFIILPYLSKKNAKEQLKKPYTTK